MKWLEFPLKEGQWYERRDGVIVKAVDETPSLIRIDQAHGTDSYVWRVNGRVNTISSDIEDPHDIVGAADVRDLRNMVLGDPSNTLRLVMDLDSKALRPTGTLGFPIKTTQPYFRRDGEIVIPFNVGSSENQSVVRVSDSPGPLSLVWKRTGLVHNDGRVHPNDLVSEAEFKSSASGECKDKVKTRSDVTLAPGVAVKLKDESNSKSAIEIPDLVRATIVRALTLSSETYASRLKTMEQAGGGVTIQLQRATLKEAIKDNDTAFNWLNRQG